MVNGSWFYTALESVSIALHCAQFRCDSWHWEFCIFVEFWSNSTLVEPSCRDVELLTTRIFELSNSRHLDNSTTRLLDVLCPSRATDRRRRLTISCAENVTGIITKICNMRQLLLVNSEWWIICNKLENLNDVADFVGMWVHFDTVCLYSLLIQESCAIAKMTARCALYK